MKVVYELSTAEKIDEAIHLAKCNNKTIHHIEVTPSEKLELFCLWPDVAWNNSISLMCEIADYNGVQLRVRT